MFERIALRFHDQPRLLVLLIAMIAVAGLSAFAVLPRMEDPRITNRAGGVVTRFPGADAERVEALVTEPIEDALLELDEVRKTTSTSRAGVSVIQVEVEDAIGMDGIDQAWSRVRDKLAEIEIELPVEASRPDLETDDFYAMTVIAGIVWRAEAEPSGAVMNRLARTLEDRLREVQGTEYTELHGLSREEIVVELELEELAALGLSVREVAQAITRSDAKVAAGQLRAPGRTLLIEVEGELDTIERVRSVSIQAGGEGQFVRLGDIALVSKQIEDPPSRLTIIDGAPAVAVGARMAADVRIDGWASAARASIAAFAAELSPGVDVEIIFDQSRYTETRLRSLARNFTLAVAAVMAVVMILMGWRSALIVGVTLPLSALVVLAAMRGLGVPIHQMSVTGLIIALGLLIDNAIVMMDEINRRRRGGATADEAILASVRHLGIPLTGSTITTILAFMPIVLMPGGAGEFVGSIALGVILSLIASLGLSMMVMPAMATWLGRPSDRGGWWRRGICVPALVPGYHRAVRGMVARPVLGVGLALVLPAVGMVTAGRLVEQFFPGADRDQFHLQLRLPDGASIERTLSAVTQASSLLGTRERVVGDHWFVGDSAPMFYYNLTGGNDDSPHYAAALVQLDTDRHATDEIRAIQAMLESALPEAQVLASQLEQGPPFAAPIEIKFFGNDRHVLRALSDEARRILSEVPDVIASRSTITTGRPQLEIVLDEQRARLAGLDNLEVAAQLDAAFEGIRGGSMLEGNEELPVRVRLRGVDRRDVADLASMDLFAGDSSEPIPLAAIADLELRPAVAALEMENGERVNRVLGYVQAGVLPGAALSTFTERLAAEMEIPSGYRMEIGGESGERDRAVGNLMASVAVLAVLMIATLVLSLNSFRMAALIAVVAGASAGLGLLPLVIFDFPFGFMGIIGIMGLIGVAINDSIVVLVALRQDASASTGDPEAIASVVVDETRHVMATTFTTIAGFTPLLLAGGTFWPPLAAVIGGGVLGATLLALLLIPCAFRMIGTPSGAAMWTRWWPRSGRPESAVATAPTIAVER